MLSRIVVPTLAAPALIPTVLVLLVACGNHTGSDATPEYPAHGEVHDEQAMTEPVFPDRLREHFPELVVEGPASIDETEYKRFLAGIEAFNQWHNSGADQTDAGMDAALVAAGFAKGFDDLNALHEQLFSWYRTWGQLRQIDQYLEYPAVVPVLRGEEPVESAPAFENRLPELLENIAELRVRIPELGYTTGDFELAERFAHELNVVNSMTHPWPQIRRMRLDR